jgi:hypothetical protein
VRGGGGSFGAVTSLVLQSHELREVTVGQFVHHMDAATDALCFYRDWSAGMPDGRP